MSIKRSRKSVKSKNKSKLKHKSAKACKTQRVSKPVEIPKKEKRKPRTLHPWEEEMGKPPSSWEVLQEVILSKVSYFQPKIFHELYQEILDDYGTTTDRTVYRNLDALIKRGLIKRLIFEDDSCYIRVGKWKDPVDHSIEDYDQEFSLDAESLAA